MSMKEEQERPKIPRELLEIIIIMETFHFQFNSNSFSKLQISLLQGNLQLASLVLQENN